MIDTFSLYQDFASLVNTFTGGWFRPQTDFIRAVNNISISLWNKWTDEFEKSQKNDDRLLPFLKSKNIIVDNQNNYFGLAKYPADYGTYATARLMVHGKTCVPCQSIDNGKCDGFKTTEEMTEEFLNNIKEVPVEKVDTQKWGSCLNHLTKCPTLEKPKLTQYDGGLKVAPKEVSVLALDYFKRPIKATFVYTVTLPNTNTGAGDQIVYNQAASKPLEWPDIVRDEFLWRLGERYGYFTREQFLTAFANQQKQKAS